MDAKLLSKAQRVEVPMRSRDFRWLDSPSAGFGFDCDEQGTPLPPKNDAAADNMLGCFTDFPVQDQGMIEWTHRYTEHARLRCGCGEELVLDHFTNTCGRCGADYGMNGQRLADRSQWGEETGESLGDILSIP